MIPISLIGNSLYGQLPPTNLLSTSLMWHDFSLATASTDTNLKNTISGTGPYFARVFDQGQAAAHLFRGIEAAYGLEYKYDSDKSLYVGNAAKNYGAATQSIVIGQTSSSTTYFSVFKTPLSIPANNGVQIIEGPSYSIGFRLLTDSKIRAIHGYYQNPSFQVKAAEYQLATASWYLVVATFSHSTTTVSEVYMKINGSASTASGDITGISWNTGSIAVQVGAMNQFRAAEFITFNSLLSASDIDTVETYLKNKWNISY